MIEMFAIDKDGQAYKCARINEVEFLCGCCARERVTHLNKECPACNSRLEVDEIEPTFLGRPLEMGGHFF